VAGRADLKETSRLEAFSDGSVRHRYHVLVLEQAPGSLALNVVLAVFFALPRELKLPART